MTSRDYQVLIKGLDPLKLPKHDRDFVEFMKNNPDKRGRNMGFLDKLYTRHVEDILADPTSRYTDSGKIEGKIWYDKDSATLRVEVPSNPRLYRYINSHGFRRMRGSGNQDTLSAFPSCENFHWLNENFTLITEDNSAGVNVAVREMLAPIERVPEDHPLFDYQLLAARFLLNHDRALLNLSPGLGKTLVALYAAKVAGHKRILVVAPKSLLYYWMGEIKKWEEHVGPLVAEVSSYARLSEEVLDSDRWLIATNPERVRNVEAAWHDFLRPDCLILDESILYKNRNSSRSKSIKNLAAHIPTTWLLSGAPVTRFYDDMWHQLHILEPKAYSSYWRFVERYCVVEDDQWGRKILANRSNASSRLKSWHKDYYLSLSQEEVLDLPDWLIEELDIPMTDKQAKIYKTLIDDLIIHLDGQPDGQKLRVQNKLGLVIRAAQVASNPMLVGADNTSGKWNALVDILEYTEGPHIIWCNFVRTVEEIHDFAYGIGGGNKAVSMMHGSTPIQQRQAIVDSLQAGKLDILVTNNVASHGLTMTAARTSIYLERDFSGNFFQSLHRIRRIGTVRSPVVMLLRSCMPDGQHTIDHVIHNVLDYRKEQVKDLTVGMLRSLQTGG